MTDQEETSESLIPSGVTEDVSKNIIKVLGEWSHELLLGSTNYIDWRIRNLEKIAVKFDNVCNMRNIPTEKRLGIRKKFGMEWIQYASQEEDSTIQSMWADLLASEAEKNNVDYIYINILKTFSKRDAKLLVAIMDQGRSKGGYDEECQPIVINHQSYSDIEEIYFKFQSLGLLQSYIYNMEDDELLKIEEGNAYPPFNPLLLPPMSARQAEASAFLEASTIFTRTSLCERLAEMLNICQHSLNDFEN